MAYIIKTQVSNSSPKKIFIAHQVDKNIFIDESAVELTRSILSF